MCNRNFRFIKNVCVRLLYEFKIMDPSYYILSIQDTQKHILL